MILCAPIGTYVQIIIIYLICIQMILYWYFLNSTYGAYNVQYILIHIFKILLLTMEFRPQSQFIILIIL